MNLQELQKLRDALPYGAMTELAEKCKVSKATVSNVLNGKHENVKVLDAAAKMLETYKGRRKSTFERVKQAVSML